MNEVRRGLITLPNGTHTVKMHELALVEVQVSPLELSLHELTEGFFVKLLYRFDSQLEQLLLQRRHVLIVVARAARISSIATAGRLLHDDLLARVLLSLETAIDPGLSAAVGFLRGASRGLLFEFTSFAEAIDYGALLVLNVVLAWLLEASLHCEVCCCYTLIGIASSRLRISRHLALLSGAALG